MAHLVSEGGVESRVGVASFRSGMSLSGATQLMPPCRRMFWFQG